jgi:hypothetical protein
MAPSPPRLRILSGKQNLHPNLHSAAVSTPEQSYHFKRIDRLELLHPLTVTHFPSGLRLQ